MLSGVKTAFPTHTLMHKIFYAWRVFATGLSFSVFGLGGPIIALSISLFLFLVPASKQDKCQLSRKAIASAFRLYIRFMRGCGLLTYEIRGKEHMPRGGQLVVANHPSLLDVVFIYSIIPNANCIVRDGLLRNTFTGPPIRAAQFICNDSPNLVTDSVEALQYDSPLIVFPEGTRGAPDKPIRFQRGAANIALTAQCDLHPTVIHCDPPTLMKHQKWYNIPETPPHFIIDFRPAFSIAPYLASEHPQCKKARRLTADLEAYFTKHARPTQQNTAKTQQTMKNCRPSELS